MFDEYRDYQSLHQAARNKTPDEWLNLAVESVETTVVIDGISIPMGPPKDAQAVFHGNSGKAAMLSAAPVYSFLKNACLAHGLDPVGKLLDFGCGWGRFLRFLIRDVVEGGLYGVDPLAPALQMGRMSFPFATFIKSEFLPPLPFKDKFFDVIFSNSVFSHLPEHLALSWIIEISRILRPGGLLIATTHPASLLAQIADIKRSGKPVTSPWFRAMCSKLNAPDCLIKAHQQGQYAFIDTGGGDELPPDMYGDAFVPEAYMRRIWDQYLTVVDFVDDPTRLPQATFVLKKDEQY